MRINDCRSDVYTSDHDNTGHRLEQQKAHDQQLGNRNFPSRGGQEESESDGGSDQHLLQVLQRILTDHLAAQGPPQLLDLNEEQVLELARLGHRLPRLDVSLDGRRVGKAGVSTCRSWWSP